MRYELERKKPIFINLEPTMCPALCYKLRRSEQKEFGLEELNILKLGIQTIYIKQWEKKYI